MNEIVNKIFQKKMFRHSKSYPRPTTGRCHLTNLTLYGHIKTAEQRTIIQQYGDWYWPLMGWLYV